MFNWLKKKLGLDPAYQQALQAIQQALQTEQTHLALIPKKNLTG